VHRKSILIYVQQDTKLHSLFYLETALHVSGGNITHYQERKQLYLQHLVFVTPLLLSAAIVEEMELHSISGFEVHTVMLLNVADFWDMTSRYRASFCLRLQFLCNLLLSLK